ncbi:hypothetical protein CHUAL_012907 [Chamberlinius hualienensis]
MSRFSFFPYPSAARETFLHSWWDTPAFPKIFDQNFGVGLNEEDFPRSSLFHRYYMKHRYDETHRNSSGYSEVKTNSDKFQIFLDVNQFLPDEITVKTSGNYVIVQCKHEERADDHGWVAREFSRRYLVPENVDPESIISSLTRDGIICVEAPRKRPETPQANERVIPVMKVDENVSPDGSGPSTSKNGQK